MNSPEIDRPKLLLKVEEAALHLGIGRSTMYALVLSGEVESVLIGRCRRVPADALPIYLTRLRESQSMMPNRSNAA
jgi:excisionase family DNA binding protein